MRGIGRERRALQCLWRTMAVAAAVLLLSALMTPVASWAQESLDGPAATSTDCDSNGAELVVDEDMAVVTEAAADGLPASEGSAEDESDSNGQANLSSGAEAQEEADGSVATHDSISGTEGPQESAVEVAASESTDDDVADEQEVEAGSASEEELGLTAMSDGSVSTGRWGTCSWSFDAKTGVLTLSPGNAGSKDEAPWKNGAISPSDLTKVLVSGTGKVVLPESCHQLFCERDGDEWIYFNKLTEVDGALFDTSCMTSANEMFYGCSSLKTIDVSDWDVSVLRDSTSMFSGCKSLRTLDVSRWDTHSLQYMGFIFLGCSSVAELDVSNWNTSRVIFAQSSFSGCSSVKALDVSGWSTSKMELIDGLFAGCASVKTLEVSGWDISSVRQITGMFEGCSSLRSLDLSRWDISSVSWGMSDMFSNCSSLESVKLSGWNTSSVTKMYGLFYGCSSLKSLDLSGWDTSSVTNTDLAFHGCSNLEEVKVGKGFTIFGSLYEIAFRDDKWQSKATGAWMTAKEIAASRTGIADTYKRDMRTSISTATVATIANQTYTGKAITPKPTVKVGSTTLKLNTDYTLSYKNNVNAGTATVTVTGKGAYTGSVSKTFKIARASISGATVSAIAEQGYTGSAIKPTPTVKLGSMTLKKDTDYALSYKANTKVGTATVTVTGKGNYTGTKSATFRIVDWVGASRIPVSATAKYTCLKGGYLRVMSGGKRATSDSVLSISGWTVTGRKAGKTTLYLFDSKGKQVAKKTVEVFTAHGRTFEFESSVDRNYVLDIQGGSAKDGAQMIVYRRNNGANQKYQTYLQPDGTYGIRSLKSKKWLTVESKTNKYVQQWAWKGTKAQRWRLTVDSSNRVTFVNVATNKCFDVQGGKTTNSAKMIVWQYNGGLNQKWKLNQK